MSNPFQIQATDSSTVARTGRLWTRRSAVQTPVFMPVGTQAAVKTLTPQEVADAGSQIILANTYHLMLRPGVEIIRTAGGLHAFMSWNGPILTDSGGYQVFSLSARRTVREHGVEFRSHHDGRRLELTPESALDLQLAFGSDVVMPLDQLAGYDDPSDEQATAADRTLRWLERSVVHFRAATDQTEQRPLLFAIAQGGFDASRRQDHARRTAQMPVDGFSIGGLSVGEEKGELFAMLDASVAGLPPNRARYLMGVGSPEDLWKAVARGVDMFDCVHPTRVARRGAFFTYDGRVNITASRFKTQMDPVDPVCDCQTCHAFSAAYIHHLFRSGEMLGPRLATIHNIRFMHRLTEQMREAINAGEFERQMRAFLDRYQPADEHVARDQRARWRKHRAEEPERSAN